MQDNRRKKYLIDTDFQVKFIVKFCLLVVTASLLTAGLAYYFNKGTNTVAFENLRVVVKSTSDFIFPIMLQILVIVAAVVGMAAAIVTLFASHRIAGPLYRIRVEMKKIKNGDLSSAIKIRALDQLQIFADECDEARVSLKESIGLMKKQWNILKPSLSVLANKLQSGEEKTRIEKSIRLIDSELERFKTE